MVAKTTQNTEDDYLLNTDPKESLVEVLDTILSKDKFFEKPQMIFPMRFAVLGGSAEL